MRIINYEFIGHMGPQEDMFNRHLSMMRYLIELENNKKYLLTVQG